MPTLTPYNIAGQVFAEDPNFAGFGVPFEDVLGDRSFNPDGELFNGDFTGLDGTFNSFGEGIDLDAPEVNYDAGALAYSYAEAELAKIQDLYNKGLIPQAEKARREAATVGEAGVLAGMPADEIASAVNAVYGNYGVESGFNADSILTANGGVNVSDNTDVGLISKKFPQEVVNNSGGSPSSADIIASVVGAIGGAVAGGASSGGSGGGSTPAPTPAPEPEPAPAPEPTPPVAPPVQPVNESFVFDKDRNVFVSSTTGEAFPAGSTADVPLNDGGSYSVRPVIGGSGEVIAEHVVDSNGNAVGQVVDTGTGVGIIPIGNQIPAIVSNGTPVGNISVLPEFTGTPNATGPIQSDPVPSVQQPTPIDTPPVPQTPITREPTLTPEPTPAPRPSDFSVPQPTPSPTPAPGGTDGTNGTDGEDGADGADGLPGARGPAGKSITETLFGDDLIKLTPITTDIISPVSLIRRPRRNTLFGI